MKTVAALLAVAAFVSFSATAGAEEKQPEYARVYSVEKVAVGFTMSDGETVPSLTVKADGWVNSGGWSEAQLGPWIYIVPPADGMLDMDFFAKVPTGVVTLGFEKIEAEALFPIPDWVKGVRVHASSNTIETMLEPPLPEAAGTAKTTSDPTVPWPWPWFTPTVEPMQASVASTEAAVGTIVEKDTRAWINLMQPGPPSVHARGDIVAPNVCHSATAKFDGMDKSNPPVVLVKVTIQPPPEGTICSSRTGPIPFEFDEPNFADKNVTDMRIASDTMSIVVPIEPVR